LPSNAPPEPTFFVDRDLGPTFAKTLADAGLAAKFHDDHFPDPEKVSDEVWLRFIAEKGWIGVSHDARIRYNSLARDEVFESGARLIVVKGKALQKELAENFARTRSRIFSFVRRHPAPWIAKLYRNTSGAPYSGRIEMWLTR
jgi:hypothetical protein